MRVALVAGSLSQGGAERQALYLTQALRGAGTDVRVFTLTRDEYYEPALRESGAEVTWIGRSASPAARLMVLGRALARFRPHVLQSTHFFSNLYVALLARWARCLGIGALRNDVHFEVRANGAWGPWLLRMPPVLLANSEVARRNAVHLGRDAGDVFVLPNAIDVDDFDRRCRLATAPPRDPGDIVVAMVCRLVWQKRVDRFLDALARARTREARLRAVIVGDGPARAALETQARALGLDARAAAFLGSRDDVPALLGASDLLVLCSEHEGTPNVILEAMAAGLPVITTPAGGAGDLVTTAGAGVVLPSADASGALATALLEAARSPDWRRQCGARGRAYVMAHHDAAHLAERALSVYRDMGDTHLR